MLILYTHIMLPKSKKSTLRDSLRRSGKNKRSDTKDYKVRDRNKQRPNRRSGELVVMNSCELSNMNRGTEDARIQMTGDREEDFVSLNCCNIRKLQLKYKNEQVIYNRHFPEL